MKLFGTGFCVFCFCFIFAGVVCGKPFLPLLWKLICLSFTMTRWQFLLVDHISLIISLYYLLQIFTLMSTDMYKVVSFDILNFLSIDRYYYSTHTLSFVLVFALHINILNVHHQSLQNLHVPNYLVIGSSSSSSRFLPKGTWEQYSLSSNLFFNTLGI